MQRTIDLPLMTRGTAEDIGLEVRGSSFDEASNTIEVVWSTGARVRRRSWIDGVFDEELSMNPNHVRLDRLNRGAPFLDSHDDWSLDRVIGSVVPGSAKIEKGRGIARVKLSKAQGHADIVQNIKDQIIRNISVGYKIYKIEETKDGEVPLRKVMDWEPHELSAVAIPADTGAQVRSDSPSRGERFSCVVQGLGSPALVRMRMREAAAGIRVG